MARSVLIADDSGFMRNLLREVLSAAYDVVAEAENGVEAVELYDEHDPDVAIIDVSMPITDGLDATTEITESHPDASVILCSSVAQDDTLSEATDAGADALITKPFQKPAVVEAVQNATG